MAAWPLAAHAQQPKKIPRLCFLTFDSVVSQSTRFDSFFEGLRDLGYVDGQTITIDYLPADGRGDTGLLAPAPIKIAPARIDANALEVPVNWALLALPVSRHRIT
jgi:hypothetical protein